MYPGQTPYSNHPNVAPDPSMYCPRVRITPLGPAPYLMMFTLPGAVLAELEALWNAE